MLLYWLMFGLWLTGAIQAERRREQDPRLFLFVAASVLTTLVIGLRWEVGADWFNYLTIYQNIAFLTLGDAMTITDPGYGLLNWLGAQLGFGVILANLVCACLFFGGFAYLAWRQPNPALAVLVAVPYLIIVVAMGYTRQAAAIGVICYAIADASENRLVRTIVLIGIAALFHKSAILILPIILTPIFLRNPFFGILGTGIFALLFVLLLRDTADQMINQYVTSDYDSQGATVRIAMNVVAAIIFLLFRKSVIIPDFQKTYWTTCSALALLSVVALVTTSASSGVDRFSLYLIPLQSVIYSRLPYLTSRTGGAVPSVLLAVVAYSALVQFVWLSFADNAQAWIPYSIALWS